MAVYSGVTRLGSLFHSRYAEDTKQLGTLKPLEGLKPGLLGLFARDYSKRETFPWGSKTGFPFNAVTQFTTSSVKGRSYPFSLDLAAAVCASPHPRLSGAHVDSAQT